MPGLLSPVTPARSSDANLKQVPTAGGRLRAVERSARGPRDPPLHIPPAPGSKMAAAPAQSKLTSFLNHPAGPKTIFFWAPMFKWGLVAAGVKDLSRPAEKLSLSQNIALSATGLIWVRYSFVITPVNYSLASVNAFVAATGLTQLYRIWDYRRNNKTAIQS
ncbi:hypothetical protein PCANC_01193 [Puccinia coronata f. sp. avenae]|uniref:Mitochondrial pyruvate carrier n=2 Tax=Puccinia coronata f. sp. avenae TaxID=200324 RepID=A0A2N5W3L2_9BASI|nr:hypothetical protein PCANC_01193 [Puccinia coronata f. sp. avenae]